MKIITLATLKEATEQEVFDYVGHHLLKQNKHSNLKKLGKCAYRGENNRKCAGGWLIADSEYKPEMEKATWRDLIKSGQVPSEHEDLIFALQNVHDGYDVSKWSEQLRNVAIKFNLNLGE